MRFSTRFVAFAFVCVAGLSLALAEGEGAYVGLSYGSADGGFSASDVDTTGYDITVVGLDDSSSGWKLWGGYNFNKWIAIEGGYADLGSYRLDLIQGLAPPPLFNAGPVAIDLDPTTIYVEAAGYLPLGRLFALFAKVGIHRWRVGGTGQDTSQLFRGEDDGFDATYGAGAELRLKGGVAFRLEWERFDGILGKNIDLASVGILYRW